MDQKFFLVPFAASGDKTAIPDDVQPSGSVSYSSGWGFDYQRSLGADPAAKPVSRQGTNQLAYDITSSLGALQRRAFPEWITTADNDGAPFPYDAGVVVMYDNGSAYVPYVSLVASNTFEPGTDATKWQALIYQEASQAQAEAGTNATTLMTPRRVAQAIAALGASVPAATTTTAGISRYATAAEATAQTITNAAVTPSALTGYVRNSGAANQMLAALEFRNSNSLIRLFDNNNDVAVLELRAGSGTSSDRHAVLLNRNAAGDIILQPGNAAAAYTWGATGFVLSKGGSISGDVNLVGNLTSTARVRSAAHFNSTTPGAVLSAEGGPVFLRPNGADTETGQVTIATSGVMTVSSTVLATSFQISSSQEVKDLEGPIEDASAIVRSVTPQWGRYKPTFSGDGRRRAFFVAENVRGTRAEPMVCENAIDEFPNAAEGERGRRLPSVDYDQAAPILWAALNEQIERNDALEAKFEALLTLLAANGISAE